MGKNTPSATQTWEETKKSLSAFRQALRKNDQQSLDELMALARKHIGEVSYAGGLYPIIFFIFAILVEMNKKIQKILDELVLIRKALNLISEPKHPPLKLLDLVTKPLPVTVEDIQQMPDADYIDYEEPA